MATEKQNNELEQKSDDKPSPTIKYGVVAASLFALLILIVYGLYLFLRAPMGDDIIGWYAQYGDAFGVVTSFFTAAGTIGLVVTIVLQYQTLKAQKEELAETRKELQGQKVELAGQHAMMRLQTKILQSQSESSNLNLLVSSLVDLKKRVNFSSIGEIKKSFNDYDFEKVLDLATFRPYSDYFEFLDTNIASVGERKGLLFRAMGREDRESLIIVSLVAPDAYKNLSDMVFMNVSSFEVIRICLNFSLDTSGDTLSHISQLAGTAFAPPEAKEFQELKRLVDSIKQHRIALRFLELCRNSDLNDALYGTSLRLNVIERELNELLDRVYKNVDLSEELLERKVNKNDIINLDGGEVSILELAFEKAKNYRNPIQRSFESTDHE